MKDTGQRIYNNLHLNDKPPFVPTLTGICNILMIEFQLLKNIIMIAQPCAKPTRNRATQAIV